MKTFCFKLYHSDHNDALMRLISISGLIYNHCIALHKRYYRLYRKSLSANRLKIHLDGVIKGYETTYTYNKFVLPLYMMRCFSHIL